MIGAARAFLQHRLYRRVLRKRRDQLNLRSVGVRHRQEHNPHLLNRVLKRPGYDLVPEEVAVRLNRCLERRHHYSDMENFELKTWRQSGDQFRTPSWRISRDSLAVKAGAGVEWIHRIF